MPASRENAPRPSPSARQAALFLLLAVLPLRPALSQGPDPDSPRWKGVMALREMFESTGDAALERFVKQKIAPSLRDMNDKEEMMTELRRLRADLGRMEFRGARPAGPFSAVVEFANPSGSDEAIIPFELEPEPPHRFTQIGPLGAPEGSVVREVVAGPAQRGPITWEGLEGRLDRAAEDGLSGSVLVVRDGEIVLDRGYGFADREKRIPNRPDTIYAIGSTPIDFTRAGILLLAQEGKLAVSDPITRYFDDVPRDKRAITIEHLMNSRSGLRDFLGRRSDRNPDHFYIDRDEAMRRIFEDELLFAPGEGRRHSHAAWGILAAIIEIVSGETYPEFTRKRLFEPAGMKDTAFFGTEYAADRMAIGYGGRTSGEINAPPHWGPTSWLVMGSGGQVSTTRDMLRWHRAIANGTFLDPEHQKLYWGPRGGILAGGDMFGFEILYTQGPATMMVLVSNAGGPSGMPAIEALGKDLAELVNAAARPNYSLGIQMEVEAADGITVSRVVQGSAAEKGGLLAGDRLLEANGQPIGDDPVAVLDPFLQTGAEIRFELERDGRRMTVAVTPRARN